MRAALVRSVRHIEVVDMPVPTIGPGEILVDMRAVGLCGSDVTPWYVETKAPTVLGHETAGVVSELGPGVQGLSVGDRVFVHHHAPCGSCRSCDRGQSVMCPEWKRVRLHPGGLAERVRVEARTVSMDTLKLPDGVGFDDATLIEPVACGVKAVSRAEVRAGDAVAVIGLGSNGILLGMLAREAGASLILGSDPDSARRAWGHRLGFDACVDPGRDGLGDTVRALTAGRGADAVFVIPTAPEAVAAALDAAAPAGCVVFYSPVAPGKIWPIEPSAAYFRDLTLRFSYSCGPAETRRALQLIERGVVRAAGLVSHRLPLERTAQAFELAVAGGNALKVLIEIGSVD